MLVNLFCIFIFTIYYITFTMRHTPSEHPKQKLFSSKNIILWSIGMYLGACLVSSWSEYIRNRQMKDKFSETRTERLNKYKVLNPEVCKILTQSDSAYFANEKYKMTTCDFFGIGLPVITMKANKAEMTKASLEVSRSYVQDIIKENNIQTLDDFHTYMQTIDNKKYEDRDNRPYPPAVTASLQTWDCDDKTHLWNMILQELWIKSWKISVLDKKDESMGHNFIIMQLDPYNVKDAAFITNHNLEWKAYFTDNRYAYLFYETTAKTNEFREACLSIDHINKYFKSMPREDLWESFRITP